MYVEGDFSRSLAVTVGVVKRSNLLSIDHALHAEQGLYEV